MRGSTNPGDLEKVGFPDTLLHMKTMSKSWSFFKYSKRSKKMDQCWNNVTKKGCIAVAQIVEH